MKIKFFEKPSYFILILPYLTSIIQVENFTTNAPIFLLLISTILIDILLFNRIIKNKVFYYTYPLVFIIFNSWILFLDTKELFFNLKFRYFTFLILLFTTLIYSKYLFNWKKNNILPIWNVFLFFYSLSNIFFYTPTSFKSNKILLDSEEKKPIVLIVLDAYSSPVQIKNVSHNIDFSIFDSLESNSWHIKKDFKTLETTTSLSLSSLFNYNLSLDNNFKLNAVLNKKYIYDNSMINELKEKKIDIYNYGLMDFNGIKTNTPSWTHQPRFVLPIFENSPNLTKLFSQTIFRNINSLYKRNRIKNSESEFNKINIGYRFLKEILNEDKKFSKNSFFYIHLMMPHYPFNFENEFFLKKESLENYIDYWSFTNKKIFEFLLKNNPKNFKIIVTGDHGFRKFPNSIDPTLTFSAFYGFNENNISKMKSVQDIGFLIQNNY